VTTAGVGPYLKRISWSRSFWDCPPVNF